MPASYERSMFAPFQEGKKNKKEEAEHARVHRCAVIREAKPCETRGRSRGEPRRWSQRTAARRELVSPVLGTIDAFFLFPRYLCLFTFFFFFFRFSFNAPRAAGTQVHPRRRVARLHRGAPNITSRTLIHVGEERTLIRFLCATRHATGAVL